MYNIGSNYIHTYVCVPVCVCVYPIRILFSTTFPIRIVSIFSMEKFSYLI